MDNTNYDRLSNTQERIINLLREHAAKSTMRCKHGAAIVSGGKVLALDCNHKIDYAMGTQMSSMHAEIATIRTYLKYCRQDREKDN